MADMVEVFAFQMYDIRSDKVVRGLSMRTKASLDELAKFGVVPIEGSGRMVPAEAVNDGRYVEM